MNATTASSSLAALTVVGLFVGTAFPRADADEERHGGLGDTGDCARCHAEVVADTERQVPHEPALDGDCTLCHAPHASRYPKLLNVRERALCTACHREEVLSYQTGSVHTPVREGQCGACHQVHGSDHAGLLVAPGNDLCFRCHEDKHAQTRMRSVHEPFVDGECSDCHEPHNSEHEDQLLGPATAMCAMCHPPNDALLVASHTGIPIAGTDCLSCHDAHASNEAGLLLPVAHEPFAEGDCEMCHMLDSDTPRLVRATGGRLCRVCHQDVPRSGDTFVHRPVADGNCGGCHSPHASLEPGLLLGSMDQTCTSCHAEIAERAASSKSVHPVDPTEGACAACHQPHSSREEFLLSSGPIRTCLGCHEDMRHGHPLGADRLDPRTGKGITCVTCHDPHGTEFAYQLRGEQSRGLCLECHTGDGGDGR